MPPTPTCYALFSKIINSSSPNTPLWPNKKGVFGLPVGLSSDPLQLPLSYLSGALSDLT